MSRVRRGPGRVRRPWPGRASTLVDLGAGTGRFALAAALRFGHVTAVDVSPAMLALLRERATEAGSANLDCVRAGFLGYEHSGPPADGVYTRNALHQPPDFWKAVALERIAQMMRPGGVLRLHDLIYDFPLADADEVLIGGSTVPSTIRPGDTPVRTSPSTSAPSTAPSGGCWSRCRPPPDSRS
jgi:SAM-dependent methyltransferase